MTRVVVRMELDEAEHFTPEARASIRASYAAHEVDARTRGLPQLGSGRIFPLPEDVIKVPEREIPRWWRWIGGLDFGWDHPTAAVRIAYDPSDDCVYVTRCYKRRQASPLVHAAALKAWGRIPWAWPHDGLNDTAAGEKLSEQYRKLELWMIDEHAQFEDGTVAVEAGLMEMLDRMESGRLKVFAHCVEWFEEFGLYHRKDGKVIKQFDDVMSATRYAIMMLRHARPMQHGANAWPTNGAAVQMATDFDPFTGRTQGPPSHLAQPGGSNSGGGGWNDL